MEQRQFPQLPKDLQHPGHLLGDEEDDPRPSTSVRAVTTEPGPDDQPIFDDPVIGWWENAWTARDAADDAEEPLV